MKIINKELLDEITRQAKESPRLRMNYNLHDNLDAKAQKLLNALEPGTILPFTGIQIPPRHTCCCAES
jgi:cupin fold WbuC family metalloprotein